MNDFLCYTIENSDQTFLCFAGPSELKRETGCSHPPPPTPIVYKFFVWRTEVAKGPGTTISNLFHVSSLDLFVFSQLSTYLSSMVLEKQLEIPRAVVLNLRVATPL